MIPFRHILHRTIPERIRFFRLQTRHEYVIQAGLGVFCLPPIPRSDPPHRVLENRPYFCGTFSENVLKA